VVGAATEPLAIAAAHDAGPVLAIHRVPDAAAARALVADLVAPGDVVLVKASRAVGLETVAAALSDAGAAA